MDSLMKQSVEKGRENRTKLCEVLTDVLGDYVHPNCNGTAPWILAELMVAALEAHDIADQMRYSTAQMAPPGHQHAGQRANVEAHIGQVASDLDELRTPDTRGPRDTGEEPF